MKMIAAAEHLQPFRLPRHRTVGGLIKPIAVMHSTTPAVDYSRYETPSMQRDRDPQRWHGWRSTVRPNAPASLDADTQAHSATGSTETGAPERVATSDGASS
jgi:hypothetical protein